MTQLEVASLLDLSQAQVSRIESGKTRVADLDKLTRWAVALGAQDGHLWFTLPGRRPDPAIDDQGGRRSVKISEHPGSTNEEPLRRAAGASYAVRPAVGVEDVAVVREATATFRQIDNRFGGGRARAAVSAFLQTEVSATLSDARFGKGARASFERAAAEMFHLAGWMSYDVGDERLGRAHLRRALELSMSAADDALAAEMLAAMSHHAAFSGRGGETADLALAARRAAHKTGAPALQAETAVLEAQGFALMGDASASIAALRRAEHLFVRATAENTPRWLSYFDRAYLSAKFAQTLRDLGMIDDAERFARDSLRMTDGYDRGKLFNTAMLSSILAGKGDVDEAVVTARDAVAMAGRVRSARTGQYLRDIDDRLRRARSSPAVMALRQEMLAAGVVLSH